MTTSTRIVVDASVWVDLLLGVLDEASTAPIASREPVCPPHVDFEVGAALLRLARRDRRLDLATAKELIGRFAVVEITREHHPDDARVAAELTDNSTYADAWYLALARRLDAPLLTGDRGMATAAEIAGVELFR